MISGGGSKCTVVCNICRRPVEYNGRRWLHANYEDTNTCLTEMIVPVAGESR